MADGSISTGRRRATGVVAHTDSTPQVVCSITLPNIEGFYLVRGIVGGATTTATSRYAAEVSGMVYVDAGAAGTGAFGEGHNFGGTGFTATLTLSGLDVRLVVTAAAGVKSVGYLEVLAGVEYALTVG